MIICFNLTNNNLICSRGKLFIVDDVFEISINSE